ncbi:halocarboxylic acid dehydrogenase DehI family protein [Arenibacterium sp. CAU 1754]
MIDKLPRRKPAPIPDIRPVPEYRAGPALLETYADTKDILRVPWMGVVTMSFAQYPQFWRTLWSGLRTLAQSAEFQAACRRVRGVAEAGAQEIAPRDITAKLEEMGYAPREMDDIRRLIETFSAGNMPYLLIATAARMLLEGHEMSADIHVRTSRGYAGASMQTPLVLMEPHHADDATGKVFRSIQKTLGLPFVNTDYRALARWPTYFQTAWTGLRPLVGSVDHLAAVEAVHSEAVALMAAIPNPGRLSVALLQDAADQDAPLEEVLAVVRLFQWLLPELVVNVACLRTQMIGE